MLYPTEVWYQIPFQLSCCLKFIEGISSNRQGIEMGGPFIPDWYLTSEDHLLNYEINPVQSVALLINFTVCSMKMSADVTIDYLFWLFCILKCKVNVRIQQRGPKLNHPVAENHSVSGLISDYLNCWYVIYLFSPQSFLRCEIGKVFILISPKFSDKSLPY